MSSNDSENEALRGTRAKELNNAEAGGRNDIATIIRANVASYEFKERVVPDYLAKYSANTVKRYFIRLYSITGICGFSHLTNDQPAL